MNEASVSIKPVNKSTDFLASNIVEPAKLQSPASVASHTCTNYPDGHRLLFRYYHYLHYEIKKMITLNFSVDIRQPASVVWQHLWNDASYRKWTSAFMEGSYAESTWDQGARIYFLTPSGEGMFGVIEKMVPGIEMTFRHHGEIKAGVEENKNWQHASESYNLVEANGKTTVNVVLTMDDANKEYAGYFNDVFPKALAILKEICEN